MTPTGLMRGSFVARVHVSPPSSDRYRPSRSPASTIRPPLFATTASACRPSGGDASPFAASGAHVAPPSVDLKIAGARLGGGPLGGPAGFARLNRGPRPAPRDAAARIDARNK